MKLHVYCTFLFILFRVIKTINIEKNANITESPCPKSFSYIADLKLCQLDYENRTFINACNYYENVPYSVSNNHNLLKENTTYWIPVQYNTSTASYIWQEKENWNGIPLFVDCDKSTTCSQTGNCIINQQNAENCDKHHTHSCVYQLEGDNFCTAYDKICKTAVLLDNQSEKCSCLSKHRHKFFCTLLYCSSFSIPYCTNCENAFEEYGEPKLHLFASSNTNYLLITSHIKLKKFYYTNLPFNCHLDWHYFKGAGVYQEEHKDMKIRLLKENFFKQLYQIDLKYNVEHKGWPSMKMRCFGLAYPEMKVIYSNEVITNGHFGFSTVTVRNLTNTSINQPPAYFALDDYQYADVMLKHFEPYDGYAKFWDNNQYVIHTKFSGGILNDPVQAYHLLKIALNNHTVKSAQFCMPEIVNKTANWELTHWGERVPSKELCTNANGEVITRTCLRENFDSAFWNDSQTCTKKIDKTSTVSLLNLLNQKLPISNLMEILQDRVTSLKEYNASPEDVYVISKILEKIANSGEKNFRMASFAEVLSQLSDYPSNILKHSKLKYNATDKIVWSFEKALRNLENYTQYHLDDVNILLHNTEIANKMISGIAIYKNDRIELLDFNTNFSNINTDDLLLAVRLKEKLLDQILLSVQPPATVNLVVGVYKKRELFHACAHRISLDAEKVISWIPFVFVPGFTQPFFDSNLDVLFKPYRKYTNQKWCGSWSYGFSSLGKSIYGSWKKTLSEPEKIETDFYVCSFAKMGYFSLLMAEDPEKPTNTFLVIACVMVSLTLLAIITTTFWMKSCLRDVVTKFLLKLSIMLLFESILFLANEYIASYEEERICIVSAMCLHYTYFSQTEWLFSLSLYYYFKFLHPDSIIVKKLYTVCVLFSVFVPLAPILTIYYLNIDAYLQTAYCFISGKEFYYAFLIPATSFFIINIFFYLKFWIALSNSKKLFVQDKEHVKAQMKFLFFIFLLLNLSWFFGTINMIFDRILSSALYCCCMCAQGVLLALLHKKCNIFFDKLMIL